MSKTETPIRALARFLPPDTFPYVAPFFQQYAIHLTLTRERKTVLGDYRHPVDGKPYHRISINSNLNPYSFLITLLHELAHLTTFLKHNARVAPHGKEWKAEFRDILLPFVQRHIFPTDIAQALQAYVHNPAASTCTDQALYKALYHYDNRKPGFMLLEMIPLNHCFAMHDGRLFRLLGQRRTRFKCQELKTGRNYLIPGIVEVRHLISE
jgi:hypothetical protein